MVNSITELYLEFLLLNLKKFNKNLILLRMIFISIFLMHPLLFENSKSFSFLKKNHYSMHRISFLEIQMIYFTPLLKHCFQVI